MPTHNVDWTNGNDWVGNAGADNGGYTGALAAWASGTTYTIGQRVYNGNAPNRKIWRSLQNGNLNHTPAEDTWWTLVADGSATKPWRSITDGTYNAVAGDDIRVAKGPSPVAVSVSLLWTVGSANVVATGVDITAECPAGTWIRKASGNGPGDLEAPVRVNSATYSGGNTTLVLHCVYWGSTETVPSEIVSPISTGTTAAVATAAQAITKNGTAASPITISGGWDLVGEVRDGETWFASATYTYGLGLTCGTGHNVSYLGFCYYRSGLVCAPGNSSLHSFITATCVSLIGVDIGNGSTGIRLEDCVCVGCGSAGYGLGNYGGHSARRIYAFSSATGFNYGNGDWLLYAPQIKYCTTGITSTSNALNPSLLLSPVIEYCTTGISFTNEYGSYVYNPTFTGCTTDVTVSGTRFTRYPSLFIQRYNGVDGDHRCYWHSGLIARDATNYRTAAPGISFTPSDATIYIWNVPEFRAGAPAGGPALDGTQYTLGIYLKKSAAFNGDVMLEAVNSVGNVVAGPTAALVTESWAQYTITVTGANMPDDGLVGLRVSVRGTAGVVYADDFSVADATASATDSLLRWVNGSVQTMPVATGGGIILPDGMVL